MKRFKIDHHRTAVVSIASIAISLGLAATATGQGVNSIMLNTDKDNAPNFSKLFTDAIDNIDQARSTIEQTFASFRKDDGGATEAKDVDHVIDQLVAGGYLRADSPVVDAVMKQDIDAAFSKLDLFADAAVAKLTLARDSIKLDDSDTHLGYTVPAQTAVDDMVLYARELQVIISATWRDHNQQPSFVVIDPMLAEAKKKTGTAG